MDNQTTNDQPAASLEVLEMGPLGQCRTCRHWSLEFSVSNEDFERFREMGVCDLITGNDSLLPPHPRNFAATAYGYGLFTGPEFGCTLWEVCKAWETYDIHES